MPKLILRCNYLKNAPPSHLANYMNYISTREGVEKIDNTCGLLPVTVKQRQRQKSMRRLLPRQSYPPGEQTVPATDKTHSSTMPPKVC